MTPKQWAQTWISVGPKLQQIRDEELRQKSHKGVREVGGVTVYEPHPHRNGMVTMQAWFMRLHLLNTLKERRRDSGDESQVGGAMPRDE